MYFRTDTSYYTYFKIYKGIFEKFSQIGGIWKVLFLIGALLIIPLNKKLQTVAITNKIFNLIDSTKKLLY